MRRQRIVWHIEPPGNFASSQPLWLRRYQLTEHGKPGALTKGLQYIDDFRFVHMSRLFDAWIVVNMGWSNRALQEVAQIGNRVPAFIHGDGNLGRDFHRLIVQNVERSCQHQVGCLLVTNELGCKRPRR